MCKTCVLSEFFEHDLKYIHNLRINEQHHVKTINLRTFRNGYRLEWH